MSAPSKSKKIIKPGLIELDPTQPTIIVNIVTVTVDTSQIDEATGKPLILQSVPEQKRFKLKTFTINSNVSKFAAALAGKVDVIHQSKIPHLEALLEQLKNRMIEEGGGMEEDEDIATAAAEDEESKAPISSVLTSKTPEARTKLTPMNNSSSSSSSSGRSVLSQSTPGPLSFVANKAPVNLSATVRLSSSLQEEEEEEEGKRERPTRGAGGRPQSAARTRPDSSTSSNNNNKLSVSANSASIPAPQPSESPTFGSQQQSTKTQREAPAKSPNRQSGKEKERDRDRDRDRERDRDGGDEEDYNGSGNGNVRKSKDSSVRKSKDSSSRDKDSSSNVRKSRDTSSSSSKSLSKSRDKSLPTSPPSAPAPAAPREKAFIDQLPSYIEMLYEESLTEKIRGTALILQLVQEPTNLDHFLSHETVMGALARVLNEERKKSVELITNILEIFFCFSSFSQLHSVLLNNKIGATAMEIIELELTRYDKNENKSNNYLIKQERLLFVCFYILLNIAEEITVEIKMKNKKIIKQLIRMLKHTNPYDRTFLNELHLLVLTFLKKMSIFEENKQEMVEYDCLMKTSNLLNLESNSNSNSNNEDLVEAALRLIYNLSFDPVQREEMVKKGVMMKLIDVIKKTYHPNNNSQGMNGCRSVATRILYNLSTDPRLRANVESSSAPLLRPLTDLILRDKNKNVDRELVSFLINLTYENQKNIEVILTSPDLVHHLIKRVHQTFDLLLIKFIRNLSTHFHNHPQHAHLKVIFKTYLHELVGMTLKSPTSEFLLESLAILGNIIFYDVMYGQLLIQHKLFDFILKNLIPGMVEDDIILEILMLLSTLAIDPKSALVLSDPKLTRMLYELIQEKMEDVDIVLQAVYVILKMLLQKESREAIIGHQMMVPLLLDLVVDPCIQVRNLSNMCLDIIMEHDQGWSEKIRGKRFEAFNREWLAFIVATSGSTGNGMGMSGMGMGVGRFDSSLSGDELSGDDHHIGGRMGVGMGNGNFESSHDEDEDSLQGSSSLGHGIIGGRGEYGRRYQDSGEEDSLDH